MLKIGVVGHRNLKKSRLPSYSLEIFNNLKKLKEKYKNIRLYSALADGADRLVVNEAIKLDIKFIAVLPMQKELYKNDFDVTSKIEFDELLTKAYEILTITHKKPFSKNTQYELAGHYISDNSDMLFALWDGKDTHLQGGTSAIVKYHLKNKKELWHLKVGRNDI